jgi:hypothetical protein
MANTKWNASDRTNLTLSGSDLIATATTTSDKGVRAVDAQYTGIYFWEITTTAQTNTSVGVASPMAQLTAPGAGVTPASAVAGSAVAAAMLFKTGSVFVNGSNVGSVNAFGNGVVISIYLNLDVSPAKIAFKVGANNWNNNVANTPLTGAFDVSAIALLGLMPCATTSISGEVITANFGGSAFTNSVPGGATSGWPTRLVPFWIDPISINSNQSSSGTSTTVAVATQGEATVLIMVVTENNSGTTNVVSSVSGGTLGAYTLRKQFKYKPGTKEADIEIWAAHTTGALSETVTITTGAADDTTVMSLAVVGANVATPWDANVSLPATNSGTSTTGNVTGVSTTNATDFVFGFWGNILTGSIPSAAGSGYSYIRGHRNNGATNFSLAVMVGAFVSSTQSSVTVAVGSHTSEEYGMIADAIQEATQEIDITTSQAVGITMAAALDTPLSITTSQSVGIAMAASVTLRRSAQTIVVVCT